MPHPFLHVQGCIGGGVGAGGRVGVVAGGGTVFQTVILKMKSPFLGEHVVKTCSEI